MVQVKAQENQTLSHANNKGIDQPVQAHSLINAFLFPGKYNTSIWYKENFNFLASFCS